MNEKMRILKMIENGQITAAEAAQLLQAVDTGGSAPSPRPAPPPPPQAHSYAPPPPPSHTHSYAPPPPPSSGRYDGYASNNGRPHGGSHSGEDLGKKFESFAREVAPKVERFAEVVADKIAGAADYVSDVFTSDGKSSSHSHGHGQQTHRHAPAPAEVRRPASGVVEKQIEMLVETGGYNELNLSGINGDIRVKGYNGDKITARLTYRSRKSKAYIELVKLGGKYFLKYEPEEFEIVSIDAYVPERAFSVIKIDGINGQLDVSSLSANDMRFSNANGATVLSGLAALNITGESSNGRFSVSNITAENAAFENLNGAMDSDEVDVANLKLSNYNAPLSIIMSKFARYSEYIWSVETGNAKMSLNLPTMPDLGYHIKAHAAMSEIKIGLTGLQYLISEPSLVEARSVHFDRSYKKVKLVVETSNAPLIIN